jgi:hypothetical protein
MKRGLFRLWFVVSACWVGVVGTIGFFQVKQELATTQYVLGKTPNGQLYFDRLTYPAKPGQWAPMPFPDGSYLYFPAKEFPIGLEPRDMTDEQLDRLGDAAEAFWAERWGRYWDLSKPRLLPWLLAAFGPALFLLVFGRAVVWVIDGLRR